MGLDTQGVEELAVSAVLASLAIFAVVLRFVARYKTRTYLSVDDYFAIASIIFIIGLLVELILWVTIGGNGRHWYDLSETEKTNFNKCFLSQEFTYGTLSPLVKLTVLSFYWRLFPVKWFRLIVDGLAVMAVSWGITYVVVAGVQCSPLKKYWDPSVPGHCINSLAFLRGTQGINVFLDVTIFTLPWYLVWKLQRPWRAKVGLCGVFLLGAFVVAASCLRMWAMTIMSESDISYTISEGTIWTFVEPCIGLCCACCPVIWALLPERLKTSDASPPPAKFEPSPERQPMSSWVRYGRHAAVAEWTMDRTELEQSRLGSEPNLGAS